MVVVVVVDSSAAIWPQGLILSASMAGVPPTKRKRGEEWESAIEEEFRADPTSMKARMAFLYMTSKLCVEVQELVAVASGWLMTLISDKYAREAADAIDAWAQEAFVEKRYIEDIAWEENVDWLENGVQQVASLRACAEIIRSSIRRCASIMSSSRCGSIKSSSSRCARRCLIEVAMPFGTVCAGAFTCLCIFMSNFDQLFQQITPDTHGIFGRRFHFRQTPSCHQCWIH